MSVAAETHTDGTPARLPKPGDVDWFLTAADRARAAKAQRMTVEAPTQWGATAAAPNPSKPHDYRKEPALNAEAQAHLNKAREYVQRGEHFYRMAAEQILAARNSGATWVEVADYLQRSVQWTRDIVSWHKRPANDAQDLATPYAGDAPRRDASATRKVLRESAPEQLAEILSDPEIRANVSKAQVIAYTEQSETLRQRHQEREVERKGGEAEHAEFQRRQRVGEIVNVARGAASGLRFVAGQAKALNLADEGNGVVGELLVLFDEIEGYTSLLRAYFGGDHVTDADLAALIGGGDE